MKSIVLSVNGKKITCRPDDTLLTAAEQNGIKIPTLCSHPYLKPYGACRICLVEDEKSGRLMAACVTPAAQDMSILTNSPSVISHRKNIVRLMIAEHPESCIVCNKGNRCELRSIAAELGVAETNLYNMPNYKPFESVNPFIIRDLSKCILCGKCIRADHDLVVTGAIEYNHRGFPSRPTTLHETPLEESNCTFCGTCVSMCPTGALSSKNFYFIGTPNRESDSICGFCSGGCRLSFGVLGDKIVETNPSRLNETVNGPTLCVRGHFAHDFLNTPDRLKTPMIRVSGENGSTQFKAVSWDEAMDHMVNNLVEIKRSFGPQSIAFIGSSKCTNEENYLLQKLARTIFETNNVINGGYWNGQALMRRIEEKSMGACRISPLSSLEKAEAIIAVNTDPDHSCPVAAYHIKRAVHKGIPLVVLDSRKTELVPFASVWLPLSHGNGKNPSEAELLHVMAASLLDHNAHDSSFIQKHTQGFQQYRESLAVFNEDSLTQWAPPQRENLARAIELIKGKKIAFVLGKDLLEKENGEGALDALFNLALITGSILAPNTGFFIPYSENNLAGALDMGALPDLLPGRTLLEDDVERKSFEQAWNTKLSPDPGFDLLKMIEAAEKGQLKALYIMGENLLRSLPHRERITAALRNLDFLIVQDIVHNRTVEIADVILPAAAFVEKGGSFTNLEGRIQTFKPVVSPPGDSLPDWQILGLLASRMGYPEQYTTVEKIRQEIRLLVPMYSAMGNHWRGWVNNGGSSTRHAVEESHFSFVAAASPGKTTTEQKYPFNAFITTLRWHLGGGTRTERSERMRLMAKKSSIELSPFDCETLALQNNERIRVSSAKGSIERAFCINPGLPAGLVIIPQGVHGNEAVQLADLEGIKRHSPGWRMCRVNIEKV